MEEKGREGNIVIRNLDNYIKSYNMIITIRIAEDWGRKEKEGRFGKKLKKGKGQGKALPKKQEYG